MATYHLTLKHGQTRNGQIHSEYIRREGRYSHGKMKEQLVYSEYGNLPDWAAGPNDFFAKADLYERSNGTVYTKGTSKRLKKEERKLKEQRLKFEKEFRDFENMAVPKFYQLEYKKEYAAVSQRLNKWQNELIEKERELKYKKDIFDKEIAKPEHQSAIEELKCVIRAKNKNRLEYISRLKEENKEMKKTGRSFLYLYKQILKKEAYSIDKKALEILNNKDALQSPENIKYAFAKVNNAIKRVHDGQIRESKKAVDLRVDIKDDLER